MSAAAQTMSQAGMAEYDFTFGVYNQAEGWVDRRRLSWAALANILTRHAVGPKAGSCIVPAVFAGQRRTKDDAEKIDVVFLDSDGGATLAEISAALSARSWAGIISSTHSHMSTRTIAKRSNWDRWRAQQPHGADITPAAFLVQDKGYLPRVAAGATLAGEDGDLVIFDHSPCPKFRVALPLARPWIANGYPDQDAANTAWKERIEALAAALGLAHDQACTDTSRVFYLPRRPANGAAAETEVLSGVPCDIFALPSASTKVGLFADATETPRRPQSEARPEFSDTQTGELIDLSSWAGSYGARFEIVKALRARSPQVFVGKIGDAVKHHIRCINEDAHTNAGKDKATFVINASESRTGHKGFAYHCRHAHCDGHDRLFFLRSMLEQGWLKAEDLTAPAFLAGEGDAGNAKPETWPPLQRDLAAADPLPPPSLNLADFPPPWPEWIKRAAEGAGAPPDYVACALLAAIGATIGNSRWGSPWLGWAHPPVINVACVGLPSAGKSPAIGAVADVVAALAADLNDDFEERMRTWRTACQEAKERRATWEADVKAAVKNNCPVPDEPVGAREPDRPRKRRILTTDPTIEAARDLSAFNPRGMLLHRDELSGWMASMDRYGGGAGGADRAFWLQAYDGGRWTSDRVKDDDNGRDVPHLTWGIVGGIQPDKLGEMLLSGHDDGLSSRFIYTWPASLAGVSDPPDGASLPFELKAKLRLLRDLPMGEDGEPLKLLFTPGAVEALQEFRRTVKAMEVEATGLYLSWLGKLPGMAVRLAVIFLHLEWLVHPGDELVPPPEAVNEDALIRALGFLTDYAVPMARRAFGEAALPEAERDARRLARWILRQSPMPETLNARALRRMANGPGIQTSERIEAALAELSELSELHWVHPAPGREGGSRGRQRADWVVHPELRR